jgi:hypothetical protein
VTLPSPVPGLVIRHAFPWSQKIERGQREAAQSRPCAIVVAAVEAASGATRVTVAPITHSPPDDKTACVELPTEIAHDLGLDDDRQWLRFDELNCFDWPGFDLYRIPGSGGKYAYGMLPPWFFERARTAILNAFARASVPRFSTQASELLRDSHNSSSGRPLRAEFWSAESCAKATVGTSKMKLTISLIIVYPPSDDILDPTVGLGTNCVDRPRFWSPLQSAHDRRPRRRNQRQSQHKASGSGASGCASPYRPRAGGVEFGIGQ